MTTLIEDFANAEKALERQCKVCDLLLEVEDDQAQSIRSALSSKLGSNVIRNILQKHGYDIGRPSVLTHRSEGHQ